MKKMGKEGGFCPACGKKQEKGALFCEFCGQKLLESDEESNAESNSEKKHSEKEISQKNDSKKKIPENSRLLWKILAGGIAFVLIIAFLVTGFLKNPIHGNREELIYVKDTGLYGIKLNDRKKEPVEYTDRLLTDESEAYRIAGLQFQSWDGTCHFIPEKAGPDGYSLYVQEGKKEAVKLDGGIEGSYRVTADNWIVYKKNGNLYVHDKKEKRKIDSNVRSFYLDKKGENLIWLTIKEKADGERGERCDICFQDIRGKREKKILARGCDSMRTHSDDLNMIFYEKDGILYLVKDQGTSEKLGASVLQVLAMDSGKGTFFYTIQPKTKMKALVEDDMESADAGIRKPDTSEYMVYKRYYWGARYELDQERYNQVASAYREKEKRDEIRQTLKDTDIELPWEELYFYENSESKLVSDKVLDMFYDSDLGTWEEASGVSTILYEERKNTVLNQIKLSGLISRMESEEAEDILQEKLWEEDLEKSAYMVSESGRKNEVDLNGKTVEQIVEDKENEWIYCVLEEVDENTREADQTEIYTFSVKDNDDYGKMKEIKAFDGYAGIIGKNKKGIYYIRNFNQDKMLGDLYFDEKSVLPDISLSANESLGFNSRIPKSEAFFCMTDYNMEDYCVTLAMVNGKETKEIGEEVSRWVAFDEKSVAMLTDYDESRNTYDLKYYNGKETVLLDTDVRYLDTFFQSQKNQQKRQLATGENRIWTILKNFFPGN